MGTLTNPAKTMKRAIRHASRDASRPILGCVHLDEHGEVVATDSYRLSVEHGVCFPLVDSIIIRIGGYRKRHGVFTSCQVWLSYPLFYAQNLKCKTYSLRNIPYM